MRSKFISCGADKYESYMGRWSRRLAPLFHRQEITALFCDLRGIEVIKLRRVN
jgi:hypothetical protein